MTDPYEWQPGYPRDNRSDRQRLRDARGPYGDFEYMAARIVSRATGSHVTLYDDNSRRGMPDLLIEHADGRVAFGEVVIDVGEGHAALMTSFADGRLEFRCDGLRSQWWLILSSQAVLKGLEQKLSDILGRMEAAGEDHSVVSSTLSPSASPGAQELARHGVIEVSCAQLPGEQAGVVRCLPEGVGGEAAVNWPVFYTWLDGFLDSQVAKNKREKLARTEASERHCFIGLGPTVPWGALHVLDRELGGEVPPDAPTLPGEITHLWLYGAGFPERCLSWWPDRGWFDAERKWVTD